MSSNQDAVLDLEDSESFSGFSPMESEEDLPDGKKKKTKKTKTKVKSVVSKPGAKKDKLSEKGKSPSKKSKTCASTSGTSSKKTGVDTEHDIGFDLSKLSLADVEKLRDLLGINTPSEMEIDDYEFGQYGNRPNLRIEVESKDLSGDEYRDSPDLSKDICDALFDKENVDRNNNETDMWSLPKLKTPQKGKPVAQSLADMVNCACVSQCDLDSVLDKYKVPENCDKACPPVVNSEVWKTMDKRTQSQDRGMVDIQNMVGTSITATIRLVELLKKQISDNVEAKTLISDSIVILGQVQYYLSVKRRYMIRPALKKKYQGLCNINMPITSKLFGEDVAKDIKSCESMSFLGRDYGGNYRGRGSSRFGRRQFSQPSQGYGGGRGRYNPYPARGQGRPARSNFAGYRIPKRQPSATVSVAPNDQN